MQPEQSEDQRDRANPRNDYERIGPALAKQARSRMRRRFIVIGLLLVALALPLAYGVRRYVRQRAILFQIPTLADAARSEAEFVTPTMSGWIVNKGSEKAIIYLSGNGEAVDTLRAEFSRVFPNRTVYLMPYPGYPPNPGIVTEANLVRSALDLYDAVAPNHESVGLVGRSMGAAVAIQVASQRTVDQMLLVSPFDRLYTAEKPIVPFVPNRFTMKDKFDSLKLAPKIRVPTVMLVGDQDTNVPPAISQNLAAAFGLFPTIIEAPGANHFNILETPAFEAAAKAAFVTTKSDANRTP